MKFQIFRTSTMYDEDPLVPQAIKETLSFHYNEIKACPPWRNKDVPAEDVMEDCWTVEVNTLEGLLELAKSNKSPVIIAPPDSSGRGFQIPSIEIYDGYRE